MAVNPAAEEMRNRIETFLRYRHEHLTGDEKGEAQVFLDRLFQAFGHGGVREAGATLEMRVARRDNGGTAFADLMWKPRCADRDEEDWRQPQDGTYRQGGLRLLGSGWSPTVRGYVMLCNFDEFWIYDFDLQLDQPVDRIAIDELPHRCEALTFLLPDAEEPMFGNDLVAVTRETAAKMSAVFNRHVERGVKRHTAQRFILQAVMAMFAEGVGLLPRPSFTRAIEDVVEGAGSAYDIVFGLFREMNAPGQHRAGASKARRTSTAACSRQ